jgi:Flp pilus assembly protein CpaB
MGRRTVLILIIVFSIIALAAVAILYIRSQSAGPPATDAVSDGAAPPTVLEGEGVSEQGVITAALTETVEVVVSLQTVERGWQMTAAELVTDTRFIDEVGENVFTNIDDAIGLYARSKIFQGETLTKDALVVDPALIGETEYGPSSLIPPGYVAMAVPMDRLSGVAYALDEGDYIDIMMTFYFYQIDEQFQTYLQNAAVFYLEDTVETEGETSSEDGEGEVTTELTNIFVLWPYGRFEELPTGDTVHIYGSEYQRPVPISMILQNARVIQVGNYLPPEPVEPATPTPEPVAEGEPTPTPQPGGPIQPTGTPYPDILLVALTPQQQLFLKYAVESPVDIDFALRGANDNQLYTVENVDINLLIERFNIEIPPGFNYSVDNPLPDETPTPNAQAAEEATGPENE